MNDINELRTKIDLTRNENCKHPKAVDSKLIFLHCIECKWMLFENKLNHIDDHIPEEGVSYLSSYATEDYLLPYHYSPEI